MSELFGTGVLYALALLLGAVWLYRFYNLHEKKGDRFEKDYEELLNADKYKVKGKFET